MTKWVVAMVFVIFATGNSFPIFFTDQSYRSLEQLDEALANGEITQEYYDEAVEMYFGLEKPSSTALPDVLIPLGGRAKSLSENRTVQFRIDSKLLQDLQEDYAFVRYDRIAVVGLRHRLA